MVKTYWYAVMRVLISKTSQYDEKEGLIHGESGPEIELLVDGVVDNYGAELFPLTTMRFNVQQLLNARGLPCFEEVCSVVVTNQTRISEDDYKEARKELTIRPLMRVK